MKNAIRRGRLALQLLACIVGVAISTPVTADAAVRFCLTDEFGAPLRRTWVRHVFTDRMTDASGCVSFDGSGAIDIRVHAHNPVIRVDDGQAFNFPVSEEIRGVTNGNTRALRANRQGAHFRVADRFRDAYDNGLRQLEPWGGDEFPESGYRDPEVLGVFSNQYILRASWPDASPAVRAWVEGGAIATGPRNAQAIGFPLVHLKEEDNRDTETIAHELGHALHFARLPNLVRLGLEASYGLFLAVDPDKTHCFDKRTNRTVAWIEAFGFLSSDFAAAAGTGLTKHQNFFDLAAARRGTLLDGEPPECFLPGSSDTPETGPMFGADVEGAIYLALFHDFARHPSVGLDFVVESYVTCASMDVDGYADCIEARHGVSSVVYQALVSAAGCNGIFFDGGGPQPIGDVAQTDDRFGGSLAEGDFNGDGFPDLAIGAPGEDVGSAAQAGMVNVLYGMPGGLTSQCNQVFTQSTTGISGTPETGDNFGYALATGDFDGDGFSDLAVGVPGEDLGTVADAGGVQVIRGSIHGLEGEGSQFWGTYNILALNTGPSLANDDDEMGRALVTGDFNGDGVDDLAAGVPGDDTGARDAGSVLVVYGLADVGLDARVGQRLLQPETPEPFDRFGTSLTSGDFDGDSLVDLAAGATGELVGSMSQAGAVSVFYGRSLALLGQGSRHFTQGSGGLNGAPGFGDLFGASLAAGDFDNDGSADLAVGVPGQDVGSAYGAGAVAVIYGGSRTGSPRDDVWTQAACAGSLPEAGDAFGSALVAASFDGNARSDLAIGVPGHDHGAEQDAGGVCVLYGAPAVWNGRFLQFAGLAVGGSQFFTQSTPGVGGGAEPGDVLGSSLAAGDFNGDGRQDLLIGVPSEDIGSAPNAGALNLLRGATAGLSTVGDQMWHQDR